MKMQKRQKKSQTAKNARMQKSKKIQKKQKNTTSMHLLIKKVQPQKKPNPPKKNNLK
jgi:hypothetical protein